jgi:hypothetical protein
MTIIGDVHIALSRAVDAAVELKAQRDALVKGCDALLGLLQLMCARKDMPPEIREHLTHSHRIDEARRAIARAKGEAT